MAVGGDIGKGRRELRYRDVGMEGVEMADKVGRWIRVCFIFILAVGGEIVGRKNMIGMLPGKVHLEPSNPHLSMFCSSFW